MPRPRKYPEELMERGVRLALESGRPVAQVAVDLGVHPEALRRRVRQAQADGGKRGDILTTQERQEIRALRKENYELRRANEILKSASVFFWCAGINRHGEGDESALHRRSSDPRWPRVMRRRPRGRG